MKKVRLTKNLDALVDDEDYEAVSKYNWCACYRGTTIYAGRRPNIENPYSGMHSFIMQTPSKLLVNHKDGDGLNNQKMNLEICTQQVNMMKARFRVGKSGYRGVTPHHGRFRARININGKMFIIGVFNTSLEAAKAYNDKSLEIYGEGYPLNAI